MGETGADWTVESSSLELGRGTIRADQRGSLAFDAAIADVDDFVVGEAALVELEGRTAPFEQSESHPAFHGSEIRRPREPSWILRNGHRNMRFLWWTAFPGETRIAFMPSRPMDSSSRASTMRRARWRSGTNCVPRATSAVADRARAIATSAERAYLSSHFDWHGRPFVAITWTTEERRFHFAVSGSIESVAVPASIEGDGSPCWTMAATPWAKLVSPFGR